MSNALLLKKAMKTLDLTGAALARRLSQYREDGRATATETVSRWVNGTNNVEPAVLAWLEELLRAKALQSTTRIVEWPEEKESLTIGVTSTKGGVGTTTTAINLSVVAQRDFGIRTNHVAVKTSNSAGFTSTILKPLRINSYILSYSKILDSMPGKKEIMVVDIPSTAAHEALNDYPKSFLASFEKHLDILLVPADFGSRLDITKLSDFLNFESLRPKICFIHRPRYMELNFHQTAQLERLDVTGENFYPFFIPQSESTSLHIPPGIFEEWRNKEQQRYHQDLFEHIMSMSGGTIHYADEVATTIERMTLIELLDHLENRP